jgi:hypothetical protein
MPDRAESKSPQHTRSLAERFGMTPGAIDDLLRGTHEEYSATPSLPPVEARIPTPIEEAATLLETSEPENMTTPSNTPSPQSSEVKRISTMPVSGGFIVAVFTVLLIVLGIAVSFRRGCFEQRKDHAAAKPVDTIQNMLAQQAEKASTPPVVPTQVPPDSVPPEALAIPHNEPGSSGNAARSSVAAHGPGHPALETTSNYEAEEHLAELKADGNSKAHLKQIRKNGVTRYEVYSH